jgi:hypothetical protein
MILHRRHAKCGFTVKIVCVAIVSLAIGTFQQCSCCHESLIALAGVLCFFIFFLWLCASLMSRPVLGISLLQRLGVIDILLILIYSLYKKKALHVKQYMTLAAFLFLGRKILDRITIGYCTIPEIP